MTQNDPSSPKFTLFFQFFRRAHFCIKTGKRGALFFSKNRGLDGRKDGQSSNFGCLLLQSATPLRVQNFIKLRKMAQIAISQKRHIRPQFQNSSNTFQYKPYSYGGSHCCVSPLELYTICMILPSLYAILVATLFAFLCHRGELRISPYL